MLKKAALTLSLTSLLLATPVLSMAHCQVPCGIYDDGTRFAMLHEDVTTIQKAMVEIAELQEDGNKNMNQLVRWITTKDDYAQKIQDLVSNYFLAQRIKFNAPQYAEKLAALHKITVYAMKCKQGIDPVTAGKLHTAIEDFEALYMPAK